MDHFGIGAAMRGMLRNYFQLSRRSGRTTSLVESVKNGDRIVFASHTEAVRVERLLKDRGVKVECIVVPPTAPYRVMDRGSSPGDGRTLFDHTWVEQAYIDAVEQTACAIDYFQREASGYGEAHRNMKRATEELSRWQP